MKGLTLEQCMKIHQFVQKYHKFAQWLSESELDSIQKEYPKMPRMGFNIKYIDTTYDTREADIWCIKFRGDQDIVFSTGHFNIINPPPKGWKYDNLYDLCMAYLTGEFKPKKEFYLKEL